MKKFLIATLSVIGLGALAYMNREPLAAAGAKLASRVRQPQGAAA